MLTILTYQHFHRAILIHLTLYVEYLIRSNVLIILSAQFSDLKLYQAKFNLVFQYYIEKNNFYLKINKKKTYKSMNHTFKV